MSNILSISWSAVSATGVLKVPAWVTDETPIITTDNTVNIDGTEIIVRDKSLGERTIAVWVRRMK